MKNKAQYLQELKDIQAMTSKMRKLNEGIMFEDELDNEFTAPEEQPVQPEEQPIEDNVPAQPEEQPEIETGAEEQTDVKETPEDEGIKQLDDMGELDKIRAITLDGMRKLADNPEHPQFQALNKIFQICNKGVEKDMEQKPQA